MTIQNFYLEITRECTLKCRHCLRGENRNEFMSIETINNAFKDIKKIDKLLLTGGEPLLAISQLEEITRLIKENNIKVNNILIITNGTILNDRIINVLKELSSLSVLMLEVSYDAFHQMELDRLNLRDTRNSNSLVLKELFNAHDYGIITNPNHIMLILKRGRSEQLTPEIINQIGKQFNVRFLLSLPYWHLPQYSYNIKYDIDNDIVIGTITIDANGNLVASELSFDEENQEQEKYYANIDELGLKKALLNYIKFYVAYREENIEKGETRSLIMQ